MIRFPTRDDSPTIFVVDPDPATGTMTKELFEGSDLQCEVFSTCRDFLDVYDLEYPGCLVLEQRIPDMSGLQLQRRLAASGSVLPLVFVLTAAKISTAVELMRGGAVHVLEKPLRSVELLTAIQEALALDGNRRLTAQNEEKVREQIASLSLKEVKVLGLIALGKSTKAMAAQLGLTTRAVEQRRHNLMSKLEFRDPLELIQFAVTARRFLPAVADSSEIRPTNRIATPQSAAFV